MAAPVHRQANLTWLSLPSGAACLDGSAYGFYFVPSSLGSSRWTLEFDGGGWCSPTDRSCEERASTPLGSSKNWSSSSTCACFNSEGDGLAADCNCLRLPYCDGASFSGSRGRNGSLHYAGLRNLDATLGYALASLGLARATEMLVTGGSAGALAALLHVDRIAGRLGEAVRTVGAPGASGAGGFFLDAPNVAGQRAYRERVADIVASHGVNASSLSPSCAAAQRPGEGYLCFMAPHMRSHVRAPLFWFNSRFDAAQLDVIVLQLGCVHAGGACGPSQRRAMLGFGDEWLSSAIDPLPGKDGAFITSCVCHGCSWWNFALHGKSAFEHFAAWDRGLAPGTASVHVDVRPPNGAGAAECAPRSCVHCVPDAWNVSGAIELFVDAARGDDVHHSGRSADDAFATLERARDSLRDARGGGGGGHAPPDVLMTGPATVHLLGGPEAPHRRATPLSLDARDAHTVWRAAGAERAVVAGGVPVPAGLWQPVPADDPNQHKFGAAVRSSVRRIELSRLGLAPSDVGDLSGARSNCDQLSRMQLFSKGRQLTLARWPDLAPADRYHGAWAHVAAVAEGEATPLSFLASISAQRAARWAAEVDGLWLHGYWGFDWAEAHVKAVGVAALNATTANVTLSGATPSGYPLRARARWYGLNLACELDSVDEYWIDATHGLLYALDGPHTAADADTWLSVAEGLVNASGVSGVRFEGTAFLYSRGTALSFASSADVAVVNCTVRGHARGGLRLQNVSRPTVAESEVAEVGCAGVSVDGSGDTLTLSRGYANVSGNDVHDYGLFKRTYQPGLEARACAGCVVDSNRFHDGPHFGVHSGSYGDSRTVLSTFTRNAFSRLLQETGDSGAIYSGRSWTDRGNVIAHNTFSDVHNTGAPIPLQAENTHAIHFDDEMSGWTVVYNRIERCHAGIRLGGGRDTRIEANSFVNTTYGVHYDARGLSPHTQPQCNITAFPSAKLPLDVRDVLSRGVGWAQRFPAVAATEAHHPCVPVDDRIAGNEYCGLGAASFVDDGHNGSVTPAMAASKYYSTIANNTEAPGLCTGPAQRAQMSDDS